MVLPRFSSMRGQPIQPPAASLRQYAEAIIEVSTYLRNVWILAYMAAFGKKLDRYLFFLISLERQLSVPGWESIFHIVLNIWLRFYFRTVKLSTASGSRTLKVKDSVK